MTLARSETPTKIERINSAEPGVSITWSNGTESFISNRTLRENCPCATCLEKRGDTSHQQPLSGKPAGRNLLNVISATVEQELELEQIWAVGKYAIGFRWGDSHDSGIYTYEFLSQLSEQ